MQKTVILFFLISSFFVVKGQSAEPLWAECRRVLIEQGFENVTFAATPGDTVMIEYENRLFRNEMTACGVVLAALEAKLADVKVVVVTPLHRAMPVCTIVIPLPSYREFMAGRLRAKELADQLQIEKGQSLSPQKSAVLNSSFGRTDLTIRPGTTFQLGNYDDRLKINLHLMPELSTILWRGGRLLAQAIIPLHDEIGIYTNEVRLSRLVLNQWLRLPGDGLASISLGGFHPERYGLAGECAYYLFNRHIFLGSAVEFTGFLLYQKQKWFYSEIGQWTWRAYGHYIFSQIDLSIGIQYADFLMGDKGWQVEAMRLFGDTEMGVYAAKTDIDRFGGVRIKIPLPPRRSMRPARVRFVSPHYFQLGYRATSEVYTPGAPVETGVTVSSANELIDFAKHLLPGYIRNHLHYWQTAVRYVR